MSFDPSRPGTDGGKVAASAGGGVGALEEIAETVVDEFIGKTTGGAET